MPRATSAAKNWAQDRYERELWCIRKISESIHESIYRPSPSLQCHTILQKSCWCAARETFLIISNTENNCGFIKTPLYTFNCMVCRSVIWLDRVGQLLAGIINNLSLNKTQLPFVISELIELSISLMHLTSLTKEVLWEVSFIQDIIFLIWRYSATH